MADDDKTAVPQSITLEGKWVDVDKVPVYFTNAFAAQHTQNEFILTFGAASAPIITRPLTIAEIQEMGFIPIRASVRLGLTPDRLLELIAVLQAELKRYNDEGEKS